MTRRQFLLTLALAVWAGPRALIALIEEQRRLAAQREAILRQLNYQARQAMAAMSDKLAQQWYGVNGFVDVLESTSLHSLKTGSLANWNVRL